MRAARLACLMVVLMACAGDAPPPPQPPPAPPAPQAPRDPETAFRARMGERWTLVMIDSQVIPPPPPGTPRDSGNRLVRGRPPTITFTADPPRAGGRSFCNGWGGDLHLHGDSLRISPIGGTLVGCDGPTTPEHRFSDGLRGMVHFRLGPDTLVLMSETGTQLTFVPEKRAAGS